MRTVVTNAPVVLFAIDRSGMFTLSEGKGLVPLGLQPGEVVGQSAFALYRGEPALLEDARRVLAGEAFTAIREVAGVTFETWYVPLVEASGATSGAIGVSADITARVRAEAERDEARRRLAEVREGERLHLARELHDEVMQHLYGIRFGLIRSQRRATLGAPSEELVTALQEGQTRLQAVVDTLRELIGELRPAGLEDLGLTATLDSYVAHLRDNDVAANLEIALDLDPSGPELPQPAARCLFRVVQEALRNVRRHAEARRVIVALRLLTDEALLSIRDDGRGFEPPTRLSTLARAGHFGLVGLAEQVDEQGGQLIIASQPGAGTTVIARLPLEKGGHDG